MYTNQILDKAKEKLGISSDYELSKLLEIKSKGKISNYRTGYSKPDDEMCFKLAEILEEEPQAIIAAVRLDAEKEPAKIEFWKRQAQKYALTAGGVVAALSSNVSSANFEPLMNSTAEQQFYNTMHYAHKTINYKKAIQ